MASQQKIYSVPPKLDLASLFVFTTGYGLLFAVMRVFSQSSLWFLIVAGFFTTIAISQAVLSGYRSPRLASWLAGGSYFSIVLILFDSYQATTLGRFLDVCSILSLFAVGCFCGYVAGTCIAGIFLVADNLRFWLRSRGIGPRDDNDETCDPQSQSNQV